MANQICLSKPGARRLGIVRVIGAIRRLVGNRIAFLMCQHAFPIGFTWRLVHIVRAPLAMLAGGKQFVPEFSTNLRLFFGSTL